MLHFENDYNKGAHPAILSALVATNDEGLTGYGQDSYTKSAAAKIKAAIGREEAQVYLLTGGTQTNQIVIDTMLAPYEGVLAAETGHVALHEAGAIEYTGHKVLTLPQEAGKISPQAVKNWIENFYSDDNYEHMVFPGMVYISHPTEYGTLYTKAELTTFAEICRHYDIPLFIDGARLAYGLAAQTTDVTLEDMAELADVFYIGGTKIGALMGEAVVFTHGNQPKHFNTQVKQHGALLAKGRLLGIQFDTLFTNNLFMDVGRHAVAMAEQLKTILHKHHYEFFLESPTNQQFVIVDNDKLESLAEKVVYAFWEKYDEHRTVIRLATSWSTTQADLAALDEVL